MNVALDAQLALGSATGIGEYVRGLCPALGRAGVNVVELSDARLNPWRFARRVWWDQVVLARRARASGAAVLHCASGTMPRRLPLPTVVTVHDVAWLRDQVPARAYARYYFGAFARAQYRHAARIVVDSRFSRDELLDAVESIDPNRVSVVYPGVSDDIRRLTRVGGDGRTILVIGTVERRKNLAVVIRALTSVPRARIVSVGPHTPYTRECEAMAASLGVSHRVDLRGYVSRDDLLGLLATSAVVAVPSLYEGFGYALAQALCAGVPAVASDRASLPEIARDDATIVPAENAAAWGLALRTAMQSSAERRARAIREQCVRRFAWGASARAMRGVYEAALDQ